jgi:hypothetical protein
VAVPIPVVIPGIVVEMPPRVAIPWEATPGDTPPLAPAELPPAAKAQPEDMANAAAITIVAIFMTSVSLFMMQGYGDCRRWTFLKLSLAAAQTARAVAGALSGIGREICAGYEITHAGAVIARYDLGFSREEIRTFAVTAAAVGVALVVIEYFGKKLRKPN